MVGICLHTCLVVMDGWYMFTYMSSGNGWLVYIYIHGNGWLVYVYIYV